MIVRFVVIDRIADHHARTHTHTKRRFIPITHTNQVVISKTLFHCGTEHITVAL